MHNTIRLGMISQNGVENWTSSLLRCLYNINGGKGNMGSMCSTDSHFLPLKLALPHTYTTNCLYVRTVGTSYSSTSFIQRTWDGIQNWPLHGPSLSFHLNRPRSYWEKIQFINVRFLSSASRFTLILILVLLIRIFDWH